MAVCKSLGELSLGLERLEQDAADPPLGRTRLKRFAIVAVAADDESDVQAPLLDALGEVEQLIEALLAADVAAVERGEGTGRSGRGRIRVSSTVGGMMSIGVLTPMARIASTMPCERVTMRSTRFRVCRSSQVMRLASTGTRVISSDLARPDCRSWTMAR